MGLVRFSKVKLSQLTQGDRFYKKKKDVRYTYIETKAIGITGVREYVYKEDNSRFETKVKNNEIVTFLRHAK